MPYTVKIPVILEWRAVLINEEEIWQYPSPNNVELHPENSIKLVLDEVKAGRVLYFGLLARREKDAGLINLGVDLQKGLLYLRGMALDLLPEEVNGDKLHFDLIFYRRHRKEYNLDTKAHRDYLHNYLVGWELNFDNKVYRKILFFNPSTLKTNIGDTR